MLTTIFGSKIDRQYVFDGRPQPHDGGRITHGMDVTATSGDAQTTLRVFLNHWLIAEPQKEPPQLVLQ